MESMGRLCAAGLVLALLAGCSDGTDETPAAVATVASEAASQAPAGPEAPSPDATDTLDGTELADFGGDPAKGEKVFIRCQSCHAVEPGVNRLGPSLAGVVGAKAGHLEGYAYSPANASSDIVWTPEKLFQYLENPHRVMPGTKMAFAGLRNPQERADVIAYLSTLED